VRHVVRTQMPGPAPDPDVEAWLAAGVPDDERLAGLWVEINGYRYGAKRLIATPRSEDPEQAVAHFDVILGGWPDGELERFFLAYAKLEQVLERRAIVLPPIGKELELVLCAPDLPAVPQDEELEALRVQLTDGVRNGDLSVSKALFTALIAGIEVHDLDDIRPTFRLYDPAGAALVHGQATEKMPGQNTDLAESGLPFTSRRIGWS
jgi:hypothetical protein